MSIEILKNIHYIPLSGEPTTMAIYSTRIIDPTGNGVANAYISVSCSFPDGTGSIPWDAYSDSNGYASIDTGGSGSMLNWDVKATGYNEANGTGTIPVTVTLTLVGPAPTPPSGFNWTPVFIVGGLATGGFLLWWLFLKK